jgi:hypothetical protein
MQRTDQYKLSQNRVSIKPIVVRFFNVPVERTKVEWGQLVNDVDFQVLNLCTV